MNRFTHYIDVLKLDTFLQTLTFEERLQLSQYRAGHTDNVPQKVQKFQQWIDENHWKSPTFRVTQERAVLWFSKRKQIFLPLEKHPLYYKKNI